MSLLVIVNVGLRFFFSSSIVVSEELSRFLFVWIVFIGSIIAMKEDSHIYVDFIRRKFPRPVQFVLELLVNLAMLYCCYFLFMGSFELTLYNMVDKSPVAGIPMGYVYASGAVGSGGMAIVIIIRIIDLFKRSGTYFGPQAAAPADAAEAADTAVAEAKADSQEQGKANS